MTIYEIDSQIASLIDAETGEIKDFEYFSQLQMAREEKIENAMLLYKNVRAEAEAIKAEEKVLAERRRRAERNAERLKDYVTVALDGQKFKTAKASASFRKSSYVEIDEDFIGWAAKNQESLLRYAAPEPNKSAIAQFLEDGGKCPCARVVERTNLVIK